MMAMSFASSSASSCADGSTNFGMDEPALCNMTAACRGDMQGRYAEAGCNVHCATGKMQRVRWHAAGAHAALCRRNASSTGNALCLQYLREAARLAVGRAERLFELRRTLLLDLFQLRLRSEQINPGDPGGPTAPGRHTRQRRVELSLIDPIVQALHGLTGSSVKALPRVSTLCHVWAVRDCRLACMEAKMDGLLDITRPSSSERRTLHSSPL
jgi:hypothetical protein